MILNKSIFIIAFLCFCATATAQDFYVSPSGNDQASGLSQQPGQHGPFQTLSRAQQAIRDLKKNGQFKEPVTVHVAPGTYQLQKPLEFDIRDSGFVGREILWLAETGTTISGGIALPSCAKSVGKLWACPVAGLPLDGIKYPNANRKKGNIPGFELFVNQQRLHLARWPDADWAHIKVPLDQKTSFSSFEQLPPLQNDELSDAQVHILAGNDWYDQYLPVLAANHNRNELVLAADTAYPLASGRRFYLQNIQSELNAPAEWFYDKANARILFIPPEGITPESIVVSSLPKLITIKGASHIAFKNFALQHGTDIAVSISNATNLLLDGFEISNVGARAIEAVNSSDITVSNSHIHDTGEGGILISGGDRKTLQAANNLVHNNHIDHVGVVVLMNKPAIEVSGVGTRVTHNLVEHAAGNGFIIQGNDHLVEKNEVHHVCEQASDCGAIYSGRDWTYRGNTIRHNSFHDIYGYGLKSVDVAKNIVRYGSPDGARGVYLDDAVGGFNITGNIFNKAGQMSIQLGGGRDHRIENNLFSTDSYAIWVDNRWPNYNWEENRKRLKAVPYQGLIWRSKYPELALPMNRETWPEGNIISRNVIVSTRPGGLALRYFLPEYSNTLSNNLVWSTTGKVSVDYDILDHLKKRGGAPWQDWMAEDIEKDSINADPCATIKGNVVEFCANSPVQQIGFQALPSDIGLIK